MVDKNSNKMTSLENLDKKSQERIMMYTTARQFKNSIPIDEIITIPVKLGKWVNNQKITITIKNNTVKLEDYIHKI